MNRSGQEWPSSEVVEVEATPTDHLEITCFDYLNTKLYSWTFHNAAGGSFSNSGMHKSLRKAAKHYAAHGYADKNPVVCVKHIEGYDSQDVAFVRLEPATTLQELLG